MQIVISPVDSTRVFQILALVARYGDDHVKAEILRGALLLLMALRLRRDVPGVAEAAIVTFAHCLEPQFSHETRDPAVLRELPLSSIVELVTEILRGPSPPSPQLIIHALPILIFGAEAFATGRADDMVPTMELLAMLLRSKDISLRCVAVWLFSHLYPEEPDHDPLSHIPDGPDPNRYFPGPEELWTWEGVVTDEASQTHITAVWDLLDHRDLRRFGREMVSLMEEAEYFYDDDLVPTAKDYANAALPFTTWEECLPAAAELFRQDGDARSLDYADVLELEYLTLTNNPVRAAARAGEIMARNPKHGYAHVVFCSTSEDREACLQAMKRGVELENISPYWRRRVLLGAMEIHGLMVWNTLLNARPSDRRKRQMGKEFLEAEVKYASMLIEDAPRDARDLPHALDSHISSLLLLQGPVLSEDLSEMEVRAHTCADFVDTVLT